MTGHAEDSLRSASIPQVFNFALAVATSEAICTEGLIPGENREVLDFIAAVVAAICTIVTYQRAVAEQQEIRIGVEEGTASVTAEAINVPSVPGCACTNQWLIECVCAAKEDI